MKKIKVLIADDHAIVRMGLASILGTKKEIEVVGDAEDGASAVRKAQKLAPDVVLMDIVMPEMDGASATAEIVKSCPGTKVLILTSFGTADGIAHALDAGASGALLKNIDYGDLVNTIRTIAGGGKIIAPEIQRFVAETPLPPPLTQKQLEILNSITRGLSNQDIAQILGIAPESVKKHVSVILSKIGAATRAEATSIALRLGLLKM